MGDGSQIIACYDPWIRDDMRAYATGVVPMGMKNMMVSYLMEKNNSEWKTDIINELFNEKDVDNILAMSIMDEMGEDKQCWNLQHVETARLNRHITLP